jgi:hypothetical protein
MYCLVLRQLNSIQKGVQSAHAIVEYIRKFYKSSEYIQWVNVDKTIIMLDGGTYQEMKESRNALADFGIPYAAFYEQDLGNILTSVAFLVEDKVWDSKTYPANEEELDETSSDSENPVWLIMMGGKRNLAFRKFLSSKRLSM